MGQLLSLTRETERDGVEGEQEVLLFRRPAGQASERVEWTVASQTSGGRPCCRACRCPRLPNEKRESPLWSLHLDSL